jgi:hypothetical protein
LTDPSGLIEVKPIEDDLNGVTCGDHLHIAWGFILDADAPCDGYIVQMNEVRCKIDMCWIPLLCPGQVMPLQPSYRFWEAWPVIEKSREWRHAKAYKGVTDRGVGDASEGTCGYFVVVGTIKFYCKDETHPRAKGVGTGDLGDVGVDPTMPGSLFKTKRTYGTGLCQSGAGALPSYGGQTPPPFWKETPVEGPATRIFSAVWNCCDCPTRFVSVTGTAPRLAPQIPAPRIPAPRLP